jgi:hypothetical protein
VLWRGTATKPSIHAFLWDGLASMGCLVLILIPSAFAVLGTASALLQGERRDEGVILAISAGLFFAGFLAFLLVRDLVRRYRRFDDLRHRTYLVTTRRVLALGKGIDHEAMLDVREVASVHGNRPEPGAFELRTERGFALVFWELADLAHQGPAIEAALTRARATPP